MNLVSPAFLTKLDMYWAKFMDVVIKISPFPVVSTRCYHNMYYEKMLRLVGPK